eukprot:6205246-Pleurochrysis_carterae.AAC.4
MLVTFACARLSLVGRVANRRSFIASQLHADSGAADGQLGGDEAAQRRLPRAHLHDGGVRQGVPRRC